MTPLAAILDKEGLATPDELSSRLLGEIHASGFERAVDAWLRRLDPHLAADDWFSRERGRQLVAAARLFDGTGSRDVAEFAEFARRYTIREPDAAGVVRVMTVHKAKGLGFDLVILPDLEGRTLAQRDAKKLAVHRGPDRSVEWVLHLPGRQFYGPDPVLSDHVGAAEADACYENLCLLYVAMTRAKRAMVAITEPVGSATSANFPRLLEETLGEAWSAGNPQWYREVPETGGSAPRDSGLAVSPGALAAGISRRRPVRPSAAGGGTMGAARLVSPEGDQGAAFGAAVHALLAEVEWAGPGEIAAFASDWAARGEAAGEALACLRDPELAGLWGRPAGVGAEVWRERAFEAVLGEDWVSGVFDRVVVERDASGRARRATVFDFKTDRAGDDSEVAAAVARHRSQLELYGRAAALLCGLDLHAVSCELVLTGAKRRIRMEPAAGRPG